MSVAEQVRNYIAVHGNPGSTAIARKLGVNAKAVGAAIYEMQNGDRRREYQRNRRRKKGDARAYSKAYERALSAGLPIETAREHGRTAAAVARSS